MTNGHSADRTRRWTVIFLRILTDVSCIVASIFVAFLLDENFGDPLAAASFTLSIALPVCAVAGAFLVARGVYRTRARYFGLYDTLNAATVGVVVGVAAAVFARVPGLVQGHINAALPALIAMISGCAIAGSRVVQRAYAWKTEGKLGADQRPLKRALIVGAGDAGELIIRDQSRSRSPSYHVIGIVDDDPEKANLKIHGVPVVGKTEAIPAIVQSLRIEEILIAIPSAQGSQMRRIVDRCKQSGAKIQTLPAVSSVLLGKAHFSNQLREVDIEDLLRRDPVRTDLRQVAKYVSGARVLITGAGGSIGSELARQISHIPPARLSILGRGENSIFEIEQELINRDGIRAVPIIADVRDRDGLEAAFTAEKPTVVYHAAAHKHVPLMESNPIEAIRNNVLGTWQTADAASRHGVEKFIYVSTDKAVNPSSVMGATKRVGEMIVSALASESATEFAIVRFGNVLGSRGSLIPLLKSQIKQGVPLRITHPEMTRYFMTIPEAVQLIVQAGALGKEGEIFILDMGAPVKILDLAEDLIRIHGLVPGEDVEIKIVGARPGEKLHEELVYDAEELSPTTHPKIRMARVARGRQWSSLKRDLEKLLSLCDDGDADAARAMLMKLAWGKRPTTFAVIEDGQTRLQVNDPS